MITYDDFVKLDIRVGTIISAEQVPDTDKLLRLMVDFSEEEHRQIVSGIAQHFNPEDLVGKQATFVINLEPRTIRGVESNGMILAVGGENFTLLHPGKEVAPGSKVG